MVAHREDKKRVKEMEGGQKSEKGQNGDGGTTGGQAKSDGIIGGTKSCGGVLCGSGGTEGQFHGKWEASFKKEISANGIFKKFGNLY